MKMQNIENKLNEKFEDVIEIDDDSTFYDGKEGLSLSWKERIKSARKHAGLKTQHALSNALNIPLSTIKKWESGIIEPSKWAQDLLIEKLNSMSLERETEDK
jgi:DNA-binding transcriptional regulator YiaG